MSLFDSAYAMAGSLERRRSSAVSTASTSSVSTTTTTRRASMVSGGSSSHSISLMLPSRLPLAPLGPQMTPAFALAENPMTSAADPSQGQGQGVSKSYTAASASFGDLNNTASTSTGSGRLISTPARLQQLASGYAARRTSLPALHLAPGIVAAASSNAASPSATQQQHFAAPSASASASTPNVRTPTDSKLFEQLQSYVLSGRTNPHHSHSSSTSKSKSASRHTHTPRASLSSGVSSAIVVESSRGSTIPQSESVFVTSSRGTCDADMRDADAESNSSLSHLPSTPSHSSSSARYNNDDNEGEDGESGEEDEAHRARELDRGKLRAIDDGGRRPSLPINIPPPSSSYASQYRDRDRDAGYTTSNQKPLPDVPPPQQQGVVPSSDPGPAAGFTFDLDYIFGERAYPGGPLLLPSSPLPGPSSSNPPSANPNNAYISPFDVPGDNNGFTGAGGERRMSVSLDSGVDSVHFAQQQVQQRHAYAEQRYISRKKSQQYQHAMQGVQWNSPWGQRIEPQSPFSPVSPRSQGFPPAATAAPPAPSSATPAAGTGEWEDTFARFVSQGDEEYRERRAEWSFLRTEGPSASTTTVSTSADGMSDDPRSPTSTSSISSPLGASSPPRPRRMRSFSTARAVSSPISSTPRPSTGHESSFNATASTSANVPPVPGRTGRRDGADPLGVWECGTLGRYWVGAGENLSTSAAHNNALNASTSSMPAGGDVYEGRRTSLVVRRFPSIDQGPGGAGSTDASTSTSPPRRKRSNTLGGGGAAGAASSAVRIHIHKHSRAPAHSLFLGASNPGAASRSSILLATKKVHLHLSAKKAATAAAAAAAAASSSTSRRVEQQPLSSSPVLSPATASRPAFFPPASGTNPSATAPGSAGSGSGDVFADIRLPRRAPPPGYIPTFVNRELLADSTTSSTATTSSHGDESMQIDGASDSDSDIDGRPSSSGHGHGHGHGLAHGQYGHYASDFATISPEVREMLLEQLRTRRTFGGRLKRVVMGQPPSSSSGGPTSGHGHSASVSSSATATVDGTNHMNTGAVPPVPTVPLPAATTYQPPWMLMAPGFLKEENERKLRQLRGAFQAAGMFSPVRVVDPPRPSSSRSRSEETDDEEDTAAMDEDDEGATGRSRSRLMMHRKNKRRSIGSTGKSEETAVDPTSSHSSGNSGSGSGGGGKKSAKASANATPAGTRSRSVSDRHGGHSSGGEGAATTGGKKKKGAVSPDKVVLPYRNAVLETVAAETMCMAIPLWDFRGEEERRRQGSAATITPGDLSSGRAPRKKSITRAQAEQDQRSWLLVTYVPFTDTLPSASASSASSPPKTGEGTRSRSQSRSNAGPSATNTHSPLVGLFFPPSRTSSAAAAKKRPRRPSVITSSATPAGPAPPALSLSHSLASSFGVTSPSKNNKNTTVVPPLRSFRVVGRILSTDELRNSGLRYPGADLDIDNASSQQKPRRKLSKPEEKEPFTAVLAICHDARAGHIEYVPEGLDALGFCGNAPQHVVGAVTPFTFERECGPLSDIGRDVVEICWAGCLALID